MEHDSATSRSRPPRVVGASRCDGFFKLETPPVDTASGEKKKAATKTGERGGEEHKVAELFLVCFTSAALFRL